VYSISCATTVSDVEKQLFVDIVLLYATCSEGMWGVKVQLHPFLTLSVDGGEW
jgi:hypothetical protein